ncbi:MAG: type IV secretion system DNA-binding domain-containing protein [Clostridia bacterium]
MFSYQGSKIDKYLDNVYTTSKLNKPHIRYMYLIYSILISMNLTAIKIAFQYNFIFSNFYIITVFNKRIDLVSFLSNYLIYFKLFYYIFSFVFFVYIVYYILNKSFKEKEEIYDHTNDLYLGVDKDNNKIYLEYNGLFQNILITGSIGSGKTSSAITNTLEYLMKQNIFGLILDVKGNYIETVKMLSKKYKKNIVEISLDSKFKYNPININLTPVEIAYMLKQVLISITDNNNSDSYWLDKTESYIKDFIVLITTYNDYVSMDEIHKLVIDKSYLNSMLEKIKKLIINNKYSESKLYELNSAISNIKKEYLTLDDRTFNIIRSEITRITDVFVSSYEINNIFCRENDIDFSLNKIYVLSIDIAKNTKLAKIIATYLKLYFQKYILSNNKNSPMFFIADEYQEFANKEDATFFSLSREYRCINIVAMQSYTSLSNSIVNDNSTMVIIQNLVNKIWFRNDDVKTVQNITQQIGKEEKERLCTNLNESATNSSYSAITNKFKNSKSSLNKGYTVNRSLEEILNTNYFTSYLKTYETVCMLSDGYNMKLYKYIKMERNEINEYK